MNPRIRPAGAEDYDSFARLFPELGPEFPVPHENEWREGLAALASVATLDGIVAGYVLGTAFGTVGHVSQLVVAKAHRRGGLGRMLLQHQAERFVASGCESWQLNVKRENRAAYDLYRRLGFERVSSCAWITLSPVAIARLPAIDCTVRALRTADDAAVDRQFGLRAGQMAWSRSQAGTLLHELLDPEGERIGFGVFVQGTRFVVPLRLRRPEALAPLLASLPGVREAGVRIGVEGDEALADLALGAGGTVDLETDRLVAPLNAYTAANTG